MVLSAHNYDLLYEIRTLIITKPYTTTLQFYIYTSLNGKQIARHDKNKIGSHETLQKNHNKQMLKAEI